MIRAVMLRPIVLLSLLLSLVAAPAVAQQHGLTIPGQEADDGRVRAGEGGDAVLPTGYKHVVWGATPEIVQGIRGRVMEFFDTPDPHISYLIDSPRPGETELHEVVKWKFWDGQLIEVHIHYEGPFTRKEGRDLVDKFQRHYGESKHEEIRGGASPKEPRGVLKEEYWTWEDPFSIQILKGIETDRSYIVIRHSRVLDLARRAQEEREREEERTERVQGIELD
jgi:hypothetical protein